MFTMFTGSTTFLAAVFFLASIGSFGCDARLSSLRDVSNGNMASMESVMEAAEETVFHREMKSFEKGSGSSSFEWPAFQNVVDELMAHHFHSGTERKLQFEHVDTEDVYNNIRISVDDGPLKAMKGTDPDTDARVDALTENIIPAMIETWTKFVYVKRLLDPLDFSCRPGGTLGFCMDDATPLPESPANDTDFLLIFNAENSTEGACIHDIDALGGPCVFDSLPSNPRAGRITVCMDRIDVDSGMVPEDEIEKKIRSYLRELAHASGIITGMFGFFTKDEEKEELWGYEYRRYPFECVDGTSTDNFIPLNIRPDTSGSNGTSYQIITPRLSQVVRNIFDCQSLNGARLENQPNMIPSSRMGRCYGHDLDARLFYDELMSSTSNEYSATSNRISPITLALLEDSGWYRVDYSEAETVSFGLGAGCAFVQEKCLVAATSEVPEHGKGFFCNEIEGSYDQCSHNHYDKAFCNTHFFQEDIPAEYQYFPRKPHVGGETIQLDYCPVVDHGTLPCSKGTRCVERVEDDSLCVDAFCDVLNNRIIFDVEEVFFICEEDFAVQDISGLGTVRCPRLVSFCPEFACPSACSGRGVCNWDAKVCECDNNEKSPDCFGPDFVIDGPNFVDDRRILADEVNEADSRRGPADETE